ncbi:translation initiation factor IF3-4, chloroplastic-like isoform X2 [Andrographis paniculata]|uniref:translation initiation factor IF3-4, chloroplastic-like isoform X2 n=1 Tax=Andrographis paniculata TaxID=175694 RepID=UPI0021E7EE87|nr:translation initiation factor IF3-4, chloroplastic-like isoform X2 [Andrographis paniculata]
MAALTGTATATATATLHLPCTTHYKPRRPFTVTLRTFSLRFRAPSAANRFSVSSAVTARYGGGGPPGRSKSGDDEALDMSLIRSDTVRLIDEQQKMVGVVSKNQALRMAEDAELDLVILSPDADPPVVRIMDYSKYRYEQQKKKREQQKKSAASRMDLKELKMGYNIDVHDYSVRLKAAQKFLKEGDKVKVIVNLKGRENEFRSNAIELIKRFKNDLGELRKLRISRTEIFS